MLNLILLCTLYNVGCTACRRVANEVAQLRVRVVHGWMLARTPGGRSRSKGLASSRGRVV